LKQKRQNAPEKVKVSFTVGEKLNKAVDVYSAVKRKPKNQVLEEALKEFLTKRACDPENLPQFS